MMIIKACENAMKERSKHRTPVREENPQAERFSQVNMFKVAPEQYN